MPSKALRECVGDELLDGIETLVGEMDASAVANVVADRIRNDPAGQLSDPVLRSHLEGSLSSDKTSELSLRLNIPDSTEVDLNGKPDLLRDYAGFFGVEVPRYAPAAVRPPASMIVKPQYGLFPHQRRAADKVWKELMDGNGRVMLHLPTGAGKTRTGMHIVSRFLSSQERSVVVWLANSAELLEQACEAFEEAWPALGNREIGLHRVWGAYSCDLGEVSDGLIVGGFQKLYQLGKRSAATLLNVGNRTGLAVVDEAHQSIATTYRSVVRDLVEVGPSDRLLGLSATPGRTWVDVDADAQLSDFFGRAKVTLEIPGYSNPVRYLIDEGYLARATFRRLKSDEVRANAPNDAEAEEAAGRSMSRNALIVDEVRRLVGEGHERILVFAPSVFAAEILAIVLRTGGGSVGLVTGNSSPEDRRRSIERFKSGPGVQILCNYGVLTTGFDAPLTSAVVIGRPTTSLVLYSQMVGRAIRGPKAGGNETSIVSTVVDTQLRGFGDVAEAFENWEDVWGEPV